MSTILLSELNKGYCYTRNNITLYKEHSIFHVKGYDSFNNYVWESFDKFDDAKNYLKLF